jgi:hypothetical protein
MMQNSEHVANIQLDEIKLYNKALSSAQVKLDMHTIGVPLSSTGICETQSTSTMATGNTIVTSTSSSITNPVVDSCMGNYWPIESGTVTDKITGQSATSLSPQFVADRFGLANGAILVKSVDNAWTLPVGRYYQGDTTITMWVKKLACKLSNFGIQYFEFKIMGLD